MMKIRTERHTRVGAVGLALIAVTALTACQSGSGSTAREAAGKPTTTVTATPNGVKVTKVGFSGPEPTPLSKPDIDAAAATLATPGTLSVCTALPSQPFESQDASGNIVGFDIDFMRDLADTLHAKMSIVDVPFSAISSGQGMLSKRCDIAAAGMSILPERRATIEFSNPYFDTQQALVVTSVSEVTTMEDLKGKRVAAQAGTSGLTFLEQNEAKYGYTVVQYDDKAAQQQAIESGQAVAAINDLPAWSSYLKQNPNVRVAITVDTGAQMGFGAAKGNTALIAVTNYIVAKAQSDGAYIDSYKKWIGKVPEGA